MVTCVSETLHRFLVRRAHICISTGQSQINEIQSDRIGKLHHNPITQQQYMCSILKEQKIKHVHYNDLYGHALHQNPNPGGHEIYNFGRPILVIITLYLVCLSMPGSREENFLRKMHFHFMTYMATPQQKNPCPGDYEIYNFGRPLLFNHYSILGLSDLCLGVEKKILKE